jgi:hypothetical protein
MRIHRWFAFMCFALSVGCHPGDVSVPAGSVKFASPAVYTTWWEMVEGCSAQFGELSRVVWFDAPDDARLVVNGHPVDGYWDSERNAIVVKHSSKLDGSFVRHEMLHSLIGSVGHPRHDFLEACGGVVACVGSCVIDAGPFTVPGNDVPRVPPDSVVITSVIEPLTPAGTVADTFFRLVVFVRNPADHPVVVQLPPSGDAGASLTFSYLISSSLVRTEYNDRKTDGEVTYFLAGETKRRVFDFVVRPTNDRSFAVIPGSYNVDGAFGERNAPRVTFTISSAR